MTGIEEGAAAAAAASAGAAAADGAATAAVGGAAAASAAGAAAAASSGAGIAGTLATLSPYIAAGSGLLSAAGSIASGSAQAAALRRNAAMGRVNAGLALSTSEADAQRLQIRSQRAVATGVNQEGASGVDLSTGSPLDVMSDAAAQGALDSEITRWKGQSAARSALVGAADTSALVGPALSSGAIQGATTLLTSGARYAAGRLPPTYGMM